MLIDLSTCDSAPTEDQAAECAGSLQKLFFSLVTNVTADTSDHQFSCPVQCFIAACSYNIDDTFKPSTSMTSMLAQWQFMLRATGLYAAHLDVVNQRAESILQYDFPAHSPDTTC